MKLISTIVSALLVLAISLSVANAADVYTGERTYSEPVRVATNDDWNGGYIGGLIGWAKSSQDAKSTSDWNPDPFRFDLGDKGATFGIQLGADQQIGSSVVVGAVIDHSWMNFEGDTRFYLPGSHDEDYFANSELYGFGTARLRVGFLPDPRVLVYATGGLAWGLVEGSNGFIDNASGVVTDRTNFDKTKFGWTIGTGIEGKATDNVRVKIEYLYADLGDVDFGVREAEQGQALRNTESKLDLHTVRLGVAYEF